MRQMSLSIILFIMTISVSGAAIAQTTGGGFSFTPQLNFITNPQNLQPPAEVVSPLDFPQPIVVFPQSLDNFGLSTLNTSTIGVRTKRLSNLEINQPRGKEQPVETTVAKVFPEEPRSISYLPLASSTSKKFYRWVDEDGVMHVTNKLDSVPFRYRKQ